MRNVATRPRVAARILCPELIGRERESAALDELLAQAAAGVTKTALVAGDAGIGKTALVRRFVTRARAGGALVLTGECVQAEGRRPFSPFSDLVRSAEKEISVSAVQHAMRRSAVELFRLLPEGAASAEASMGMAGARERIHESFVAFLGDLARRRTLVLLIEDLHWADEASLELFAALARRLRSRPLLIVATYRTDELHRLHPLRPLVADLVRARIADTVPVAPLTTEASAAVIRASLAWDAPPLSFREAIQARCDGNPFFIEEVLQALVERGSLIRTDGDWRLDEAGGTEVAIPPTIHSVVQDRVALLDVEARRVLEVAAVIGQNFEFSLLGAVTRAPDVEITRALRAAVAAQLVVETDAADMYGFRHALTRESVLAGMLERERRMLHQVIGEAIESAANTHQTAHVEELAYHFDEAHEDVRALRYRDAAAREAVGVGAYARAIQHLERAVALARDDHVLADLQLRLAEAATHASDTTRAERAALAARDMYAVLGDQLGVGTALLVTARNRWSVGGPAEGNELHRQAVRVLEPLGVSAALAQAYAEIAWQANATLDAKDREALAERAVDVARRADAPAALAWALQALALARFSSGRPDADALEALREGLRIALEHRIADTAQRGYLNLRATLYHMGAPLAECEAVFVECEAHARRFGVRTPLFVQHSSWRALGRGDWEQARTLSAELAASHSHFVASAQLCRAYVDLARNGPDHVLHEVESVGVRLAQSADAMIIGVGHHVILLHVIAGQPREALGFAEGAPVSAFNREVFNLCGILAALDAGDDASRDRWMERPVGQLGARARSPVATARQLIVKAERDVRAGLFDAAIEAYAEAIAALADDEHRFIETLVRLRRADMLLSRDTVGDVDAAAVELATAVRFWRRVGATWYLGQLRTWAKDRGVPFPRPARPLRRATGSTPELTAREREVAMLVAQGLTNREIATELVISARTAEGHIEQIRNKLGVRSRSLIAVWASGASETR